MRSCLYFGHVMHARLQPVLHRFRYRVFTAYLDLDELDDLQRRLRLFSVNRPNLFSFQERDHGTSEGRDGQSLRQWITSRLDAEGVPFDGGAIAVLCFPRVLGYVFNPLSIYFCRNRDGRLAAVVYEVHNTFKERHAYVLPVMPESADPDRIAQNCDKDFYVSPFIRVDGGYSFRVRAPAPDRPGMSVLIRHHASEGEVLRATISGRKVPLTDRGLMQAFVAYPLMTLKVMAGIHWQAVRLWRKGAKFHPHVRRSAPHPVSGGPVSSVPSPRDEVSF